MVQDKTPLFVETDEAGNVTNFAEFVSGTDVVSQELGGTGATSVSGVVIGLGSSILINELASGVSGAAQQATGLVFNPATSSITPESGVLELNLTAKTIQVSSVVVRELESPQFIVSPVLASGTVFKAVSASATAVSGLTFNGMTYPAPYSYMQMNSDGTSTAASSLVGAGATVASINLNTAQLNWNDTTKLFEVKETGTYECLGTITFEGGATLVLITLVKNEFPVLSVTPRVHSTVDPVERTVRAIFTATAGDTIGIYHDSQSGNTVKAITGTTMSIKRLS